MSLTIKFTGYTKDGTLTVMLNGKRYKYYAVPPFQKEKMDFLLSIHDVGGVVRLLKKYSRPDLFSKHGSHTHQVMEKEFDEDTERRVSVEKREEEGR